ncbi:MAG: spore cortex-lytic protein [Clostridiales bacterium]|nr:spore cortex-lytic protein [Clostridiales bacterium]
MPDASIPIIPQYITVHLGAPDQPARNVTVPFIDYIKNVASSEIYPTWPEASLRANILAQISFALNRIYTEWYRSRGYDFDITNSTQYDQKFIENREYFENISRIVDEIFNNYVVRQGFVQPLFTQYCDGRQVTCEGLSQWGTVTLAEEGLNPYSILQNYYGDNINIVLNAPVSANIPSYPDAPLQLGDAGEDVRTIQRQLNRIADNYPAIPTIPQTNGIFDLTTESAVRKFQEIFNLTPDGIVGKATWYKIKYIYSSVKRLSELSSEGLTLEETDREFSTILREGDQGVPVRVLQYYLDVIGYFDNQVPVVRLDGYFGPETRQAVIDFQVSQELTPDGIVGRNTWNRMTEVYETILRTLPAEYQHISDQIYPGRYLSPGMEGDDVESLQRLLQQAARIDPSLPKVQVTGVYGPETEEAIRMIQERYGLPVNGITSPLTWGRVVLLSKGILA